MLVRSIGGPNVFAVFTVGGAPGGAALLLGQACELEHGLICEYLFVQFSLKRSGEL